MIGLNHSQEDVVKTRDHSTADKTGAPAAGNGHSRTKQSIRENTSPAQAVTAVSLLTGGGDRHYAFGLAMALVSQNLSVDFIGGDEVDSHEMHRTPGLTFFNLRRNSRANAKLGHKISRVLDYYSRLILYAARAKPRVFHILWNNKFELFDRTLLMLYYKILGKKLVMTAHNVNAGVRDSNDGLLNRLTLRIQYRLANHIFVHTRQMKQELHRDFGVRQDAVSVIPYGINNAIPATALTPSQAKSQLGISPDKKAVLFFGNIAPYKGLEYLVEALQKLLKTDPTYHVIVAGRVSKGSENYADNIRRILADPVFAGRTTLRVQFIPDEETELYFKAADVLVLPYRHIFQSGVMFFGYSFGLPVIVADVGALREDVVEGATGYVFRPEDSGDLARVVHQYFSSGLYRNLAQRRAEIRNAIAAAHSWDRVGAITSAVYGRL